MGEVPGENKRGRWRRNLQRGCAGTCVWTCAGRGPGQGERLGHVSRVRIPAGGSRTGNEYVFLGVAGCGKANTELTAPKHPRTAAWTLEAAGVGVGVGGLPAVISLSNFGVTARISEQEGDGECF